MRLKYGAIHFASHNASSLWEHHTCFYDGKHNTKQVHHQFSHFQSTLQDFSGSDHAFFPWNNFRLFLPCFSLILIHSISSDTGYFDILRLYTMDWVLSVCGLSVAQTFHIQPGISSSPPRLAKMKQFLGTFFWFACQKWCFAGCLKPVNAIQIYQLPFGNIFRTTSVFVRFFMIDFELLFIFSLFCPHTTLLSNMESWVNVFHWVRHFLETFSVDTSVGINLCSSPR